MMSNWLVLNDELAERREVYRRVSAEHGYPSAEVEERISQTWHNRFVYVHEDERRAIEDPREHFMSFMGAASQRPGPTHRPGHAPLAYEEYLRQGTAFYGTPTAWPSRSPPCATKPPSKTCSCTSTSAPWTTTKSCALWSLLPQRSCPN